MTRQDLPLRAAMHLAEYANDRRGTPQVDDAIARIKELIRSGRLPPGPRRSPENLAGWEAARPTQPQNPDALVELIEVRRLFEPVTAALAASRITDDELAEVAAQLEAMAAARDDLATFSRLDVAFHRTVSFVTGNGTLASLLNSVTTQTALARMPRRAFDRDTAETVLAEHAAIHAALSAHDPTLAQATALMHVNTTEKWLRGSLTSPSAP